MDKSQIIELFMLRTGASKELANKYIEYCDGILHTALVIFRADLNEGKVKL
ncbi:hypothetical protein RN333_09240 [Enterobacter kobei]|uniref:hypothetical protein n=1 Tax=Enterobacter kobei TaxID=208224 RepID=UPI0028CFE345|nr:hypothetical protein [Enterobacter kobei]WNP36356.1 hypothetical protein RN333_09240 [Enterobacter kobei]